MKITTSLLRGSQLLYWELKRVIIGTRHSASIDITDSCNLKCSHCYHFQNRDHLHDEVPLDTWRERFEKLFRSGIKSVTLLGGEPACRLDVVMCANKIFPLVDVITNGTIPIPPEFKHRIYLSIEGSPKTNDSIRGEGVFSKIVKNYAGDSRIVVITTLNRNNYTELDEIVSTARKYGFSGVVCGLYCTPMESEDPQRLLEQDRRAILNEIKRVRSIHPDILKMSDLMLDWYEKADHHDDSCYSRDQMLHYDVSFNRKKCFGYANCSNCGCLAGASQSPLKKLYHPYDAIKTFLIQR